MPRNSKIKGPTLRHSGPLMTPEMELFLVDGFDLFGEGFADRAEEMRRAWLTHRAHLMRVATRDHGPGSNPWAFHAFEFGPQHEAEAFAALPRNSILPESQLIEVRAMHAEGETPEEISRHFGISFSQVAAILAKAAEK